MNERTDGQASRQANEPSRPGRAAGRLQSNDLATLHRTPEDLYPRLPRRGILRRDSVQFGSVRFDSARPSALFDTNHVTYYTLLAIRPTAPGTWHPEKNMSKNESRYTDLEIIWRVQSFQAVH
nr:PREDICTED: uncharacterized protein LOC105663674 [Megachile rotundata]